MQIKEIGLSELIPYEKNSKKHPEKQVQQIANSLREFGWQQPIVIDKDNVVVIGHGRLMAAKQLGMDTVPCVLADELTPEQIRGLRLADNKLNESEWDFEFLEEELAAINELDMEDFGFEKGEEQGPLFDYIANNEFIETVDRDVFEFTLILSNQYKDEVESYVKEHGKKPLVDLVLKEVKNAEVR